MSKTKGEISIKEKEQKKKDDIIEKTKKSELYKKVLEKFPDADLLDVNFKDENNK